LLPIAHQFVDKPCDAHHIENVIERCLQLHELLTEPRLRAVLGCIRSLPAMPRTYARLQAAMAKEEACVAEIASIVQDDPAIAAKVLQAVNSAFFRLARTITRIDQAVSYLGFNTLRAVVMSVEVACMWKLKRSCSAIDPELLQEHAKRVAAAARALCTEPSMADEALLAGLLHNIGYWVLLQECPDDLSRALRLAQSQAIPLHEAEREIIGASNAQLGAYLLGLWGLPYSVIEAVAFRHAAGRIRQSRFDVLAALVTADGLVPQSDPAFARLSAPVETAAGQAYLNSLHAPFDWAEAQRRVLDTIGDPQS
jgi:HD-like signal output (HDOD) protein